MQPFQYHVIVCTQAKSENVTSCAASGGAAVAGAFYGELAKQGLADEVIVSTTGCLGACDHGPVVVVYPEGTWYGAVKPSDVAEIVSSHLRGGKPVQRLMLTDAAGLRREILEHRQKFYAMMEMRDEAGIVPDDINQTARSFMPSRALLSALELDLFSAVGQGASAEEVARKLHTDTRGTEMLLHAVAALNLLEKRDGRFFNTPTSARFLTDGSRDNARPALMHTVHLWPRWSNLTECVRQGKPPAAHTRSEEQTRAFIAAMDRNAKELAGATAHAVGNGFKRMLDLGGGSGAYSIAFAKANPQLRVDLLDMANVVQLTQQYLRQAGVADRVSTRAGDMLTDDLGQGYDLALLAAICHMFSPEQNLKLFRRIYGALTSKGRLVVRDFILEPDKTAPQFAALFSLNMLVNTEGGASYSEAEYAEWLRAAGFSEVQRVRLPGPSNLMIAIKA